ncbi:Aldo-keto reductase family 1 member B10 [Thelohanellus kitauei]|uniref:Aldo-keto reductase family 1 member B10 n=1 Tax=Thelohanellus kitauei TaxID=669202 RepID=A0A0C2IW93_THEKT|nr:Aldo-keto reductase family 1 member B10 [Thelohanellus kitauei]
MKLIETGKVKRIGVSNFTTKKLQWILDEDEKPANNQVEIHPYIPQKELITFCKDHGIVVSAFSPLGAPNTKFKHINNTSPSIPKLLDDPLIVQIARNHMATAAQVLLKWNIMRNVPVLVKSSSQTRMKENLESLTVELTEEDMASIGNISKRYRYVNIDDLVLTHRRAEDGF